MNNKSIASSFDADEIDEHYVVNLIGVDKRHNFAARGYVTYFDNGTLTTVYSNQINIINTQQV